MDAMGGLGMQQKKVAGHSCSPEVPWYFLQL